MLSLSFEPQPLLQKGSKASVCIHAKARGSFLLRYGDTIFGGTTLGEFWPFCPKWPQTPSPPDFTPEVACAT